MRVCVAVQAAPEGGTIVGGEGSIGKKGNKTTDVLGGAAYILLGGAGDDILASSGSSWRVDGDRIEVGGATYIVHGMETLQGGANVDTFTVSGNVNYSIDGGAGDDILVLASDIWRFFGSSVSFDGSTYALSNIGSIIVNGDVVNTFAMYGSVGYGIDDGSDSDSLGPSY